MISFKATELSLKFPQREPLNTLSDLQCGIVDHLKEAPKNNHLDDRFIAIILSLVMHLSDSDLVKEKIMLNLPA